MGTFITAYVIGWAVVAAYLGRLAVLNRRLTRRLDELRMLVRGQDGEGRSPSKAA